MLLALRSLWEAFQSTSLHVVARLWLTARTSANVGSRFLLALQSASDWIYDWVDIPSRRNRDDEEAMIVLLALSAE